ncbi:MAG: GNAT family N-acetyltransferase [Candidatus Lokiarchaeota archaeon]|nr:GNAT family N-acetyltransferase [Candidatus Lokiarchaeota archaeon]
MSNIKIIERKMTNEEFAELVEGFRENEFEHTDVHQTSERISFVVVDGNKFIGSSSGLAYKYGDKYSGWFHLTDVFITKRFRGKGYGRDLLLTLETKLKSLGIQRIWTWTAGYQAPGFYEKLGYEKFCELEKYYLSGHSHIGMRKTLDFF